MSSEENPSEDGSRIERPPPLFPVAAPHLLQLHRPRTQPESFASIVAGPGLIGFLTGGLFSSNPTFTRDAVRDIEELDKRRAVLERALSSARDSGLPGSVPGPSNALLPVDVEKNLVDLLAVTRAVDDYLPMLSSFVDIVASEPRLVTKTPNFTWSAILTISRHLSFSFTEGIGFTKPQLAVSSFHGELYQTVISYAVAQMNVAYLLLARCTSANAPDGSIPSAPPSPSIGGPNAGPLFPPANLPASLQAAVKYLLSASSLLLHLSRNVLPTWPDPPELRPPELFPAGALALSNVALGQAQFCSALRVLITRPTASRALLAKLFAKASDYFVAAQIALRDLPQGVFTELDRGFELYVGDAPILARCWAEAVLGVDKFDKSGEAGAAVALLTDAQSSLTTISNYPSHPCSQTAANLLVHITPLLNKAQEFNDLVVFQDIETDVEKIRSWIGDGKELVERTEWHGWTGDRGFGRGVGTVLSSSSSAGVGKVGASLTVVDKGAKAADEKRF